MVDFGWYRLANHIELTRTIRTGCTCDASVVHMGCLETRSPYTRDTTVATLRQTNSIAIHRHRSWHWSCTRSSVTIPGVLTIRRVDIKPVIHPAYDLEPAIDAVVVSDVIEPTTNRPLANPSNN